MVFIKLIFRKNMAHEQNCIGLKSPTIIIIYPTKARKRMFLRCNSLPNTSWWKCKLGKQYYSSSVTSDNVIYRCDFEFCSWKYFQRDSSRSTIYRSQDTIEFDMYEKWHHRSLPRKFAKHFYDDFCCVFCHKMYMSSNWHYKCIGVVRDFVQIIKRWIYVLGHKRSNI